MAYTSQSLHRAALLVGSVTVLGLLTACGNGTGVQVSPSKVSGTAAPATDGATAGGGTTAAPSAAAPDDSSPASTATGDKASGSSTGGTGTATNTGARCHTSELSAAVGRNDPGAGQENFPLVLTNKSGRTCTVHGFPGAAFVNASGGQLGPDPKRSSASPTTVTLKPGQSAWAGLTFSNPEISGAKSATPAAVLITPPDERDSLKVTWTAGTVPVSGNASTVSLMPFSPGTGA